MRFSGSRTLQAGFVLLAFAPVLSEWLGYAARVSRLGYSLLVPPLALVLVLTRGRPADAGSVSARSAASGHAALAAAALLLGLGSLASVFTLQVAGFPLAVVGLVALWHGIGGLVHWRAALLFLLLMVPVPLPLLDGLNPTLVEASGRVALFFARGLDADAQWIGTTLVFDQWELVVADACSGSGTSLTLAALAAFLAGLFRLPPWLAATTIVLTGPLSLVVNGLRIAASAACLAWFGPEAASGLPHEILGQVLVLGTSALLVLAVLRLTARAAPGGRREGLA
jgi:exosortase